MTISKHVYSAFLIGSPDVALSVKGGSVTLDAGTAPHVTADIDVAVPGTWSTEATTYSGWTTQRTNFFADPRATSLSSFGAGTLGTRSLLTDFPGDIPTALRWTRTGAGTARVIDGTIGTSFPTGVTITVSGVVRSSTAGASLVVIARPTASATTGSVTLGTITIAAADTPQAFSFTGASFTAATTVTSSIVATSASGAIGATFDFTALKLEVGSGGPYFDGSTPDPDTLSNYAWTGTANASRSIFETRTVTYYGGPKWTPDPTTLAALDGRNNARIKLTVAATFPGSTQSRTFNLGLRDRSLIHKDGTVSLSLASDEALLGDYAPLADDTTPLNYQSSLRGVVNYVLNKAIPGAALASTPSTDFAVPALADSRNLIRNPRALTNTTDWEVTWATGGATKNFSATGGPGDSPSYMYVTSTATSTGMYHYMPETAVSIAPGRKYELSVWAQAPAGESLSLDAWMLDASTIVGASAPNTFTTGAAWKRVSVTFTAPANATRLRPRLTVNGSWPSGRVLYVSGWRLSETTGDHDRDILYFDGAFSDTTQYDYAWTGTAHASISTRVPLVDSATPQSLTWRAGQTALDFLAPLVQSVGLRLVCNEARQWTLRNEDYTAAGSLSIRHGINMIEGTDKISRDAGIWFDAAVTRHTWNDNNGITQERVDSYALTTPYTRLMTFEKTTPYPGPGFSQYAVRRAQQRGREVEVTAVSDWLTSAEEQIAIVLENAPTQLGKTQRVVFDLNQDEMVVNSRTTDTPAGAIDLLAGTIDALVGTIDSL